MNLFNPEHFLILIVDDISQNLQVVGSILDQAGYNTTFALGGHQALDRVEMIKPDLILLDWMMPDINGLEVCQTLKANPCYQDIPIIAQTAMAMKGDRETCLAAGVDDYISKPIELPLLASMVAKYGQRVDGG